MDKVLQDLWQDSPDDVPLGEVVPVWSLLIHGDVEVFELVRGDQGRVAKVMRHHDRWVERGEVKNGDWILEVAPCWFNHDSALVLAFVRSFVSRDQIAKLLCLPVKLGCYLDLLTTSKEVLKGNSANTRDLRRHEKAVQLCHQAQREVCIFNAIDCKSSPCVLVFVLKVSDDRMMDVFFLFAEELGRD